MTPNRPPGMPPVPRDHADATFSEVVPFRSSKIRLLKSPVFILFLVLAITVPALFNLRGLVVTQQSADGLIQYFGYVTNLTIFAMLAVMLVGVFAYARPTRSIWTYLYATAAIVAIMLTPLMNIYFFVFREVLPGDIVPPGAGFGATFIGMFFGAGLCEELMKATPVLIAAAVGRSIAARGGTTNGFARGIALRGPLDGVLMGMFAGAGFIFIETAFQYVPGELVKFLKLTGSAEAGMTMALLLMVPRVLNGCVGHMAYAAVFGYFIGLAVVRPRQAWKLLTIGWLTSSLLHGLWNSVDQITPILYYLIAILSGIGAAAVLLKARQLETTLFGVPLESGGSILVERAVPPMPAPVAPTYAPRPMAAAAEAALTLSIDGLQIPVRSGAAIDLSAEPALADRGAGVTAAVVAHPTRAGVLGLRNTGTGAWTAWLRDGSHQRIEREQNVRLAPGVRIELAAGLVADVVVRG